MKKVLVVLAVLVVGFISYAVIEQARKDAAMKEVRAANEETEKRTQDITGFIEEEKRQQESAFDGEPYVQLSGRAHSTDSESKTGTLIVPSGARPLLLWQSAGAQSCTMSPLLRPDRVSVGTNTNGQIGPIEQDVTYTITCTLAGGGTVSDTLQVRVE